LERLSFAGAACHDPVGSLILCTPPNVDLSVINGRVVVDKGTIPGFDLERVIARHNELAIALAKQH